MLYSSKFRPAWWLRNPHAQTLWAAKVQHCPAPETKPERLYTPDEDFIDLHWNCIKEGPTVVIFHGLTGSIKSHYVKSLMRFLQQRRVRAVLMHFRGCSGEPNKTRGSYHSGHTEDIRFVLQTLRERYPHAPLAAAGFSLGGNALLKYLAKHHNNPLSFAASVCPPLLLKEGAKRMDSGFSRIYQRALLKQMVNAVRSKQNRYPKLNLDQLNYESATNFYEFDHCVTAPLHGYASADDYYEKASSLNDLINIKTPTHILWSRDDPFFSQKCIPKQDQLSDNVDFELATHGGHVAFISGKIPFSGHTWMCNRIGSLLISRLSEAPTTLSS